MVLLASDRDESVDGEMIDADARGWLTGEHWNIDGHQINGNQPKCRLEEVCDTGNGAWKLSGAENAVT